MNKILKTHTLEGIDRRISEAEGRIRELVDRMVEMTTLEQKEEREMKRNEDNLRDHWDNIECTNIYIINIPEGREGEKGPKKIFKEIIGENFPNVRKKTFTKVKEGTEFHPR